MKMWKKIIFLSGKHDDANNSENSHMGVFAKNRPVRIMNPGKATMAFLFLPEKSF